MLGFPYIGALKQQNAPQCKGVRGLLITTVSAKIWIYFLFDKCTFLNSRHIQLTLNKQKKWHEKSEVYNFQGPYFTSKSAMKLSLHLYKERKVSDSDERLC